MALVETKLGERKPSTGDEVDHDYHLSHNHNNPHECESSIFDAQKLLLIQRVCQLFMQNHENTDDS